MTHPSRTRPAAVLWDMDGTIVDTEEHWIAAADEIVRGHGLAITDRAREALVGTALPDGARLMRELGVPLAHDELIARWIELALRCTATGGMAWRPGSVELLAGLRAASVPLALVTMSYRVYAERVMAALPEGTFTVTVTGDDVVRGKPFPDAYLRATSLLDVDPAACVAIEDSPTGLAAARAAGVHTVGVPHHLPLAADSADVLWPTLAGREAHELRLPLRAAG